MPRLPLFSGKDVVRVLSHFGYRTVRQRGSHIRLACPGKKSVTVPDHKVIGPGLLKKILRDIEMSIEDFRKFVA